MPELVRDNITENTGRRALGAGPQGINAIVENVRARDARVGEAERVDDPRGGLHVDGVDDHHRELRADMLAERSVLVYPGQTYTNAREHLGRAGFGKLH